jgi:crotonobetainyl-CoA:carnitine CoA-transferase CaiB-like acyl-CoA transferase
MTERPAPLAGLRVVDLADEKGELCGRLLADMGADVIRVEPPAGAVSRTLPPLVDGQSLYFGYRNANKRGVVLDLNTDEGRAGLHRLLATADVLIESHAPWELGALDLKPSTIAARHPHLVMTSISDFGHTGPYRDMVAVDAVMNAMGGTVFKAGRPEREPLIPPGAMAYDVAGVHAAFATLCALWQGSGAGSAAHAGWGQHIDLSVLEATAQITDWSYPNASVMRAAGLTYNEKRAGNGMVYTIYKTMGGYVRMIILSPRQWRAMRAWLGEPEWLQDDSWDLFPTRLANTDVLTPLYVEHFSKMSMEEVSVEAHRRGIVCTPVLRPAETLRNEHLVSRDTFVDFPIVPRADGRTARVASGFFEIDDVRQGPRTPAPTLGQHSAEVEAELASGTKAPEPALPLAGLRVLDFGIGGVGVEGSRLLAEYGADVIKVESRTYPDFIRIVSGTEMSPSFASSSRSKRALGINAKTPDGQRLLHRLIEQTDVIIENSSTGTMDDLGIGWKTVHAINPRCVMVDSQLMGTHGAWADWIGYGPSTQPVGSLVHLWSYPDTDEPAGSQAIYPDHLAGRLCAVGALAVLLGRERVTGEGARVEVAQVEAVVNMLGDLLAKESLEPGTVKPMGNRNDRGAPWGLYPCAGDDQWVAICVRGDHDWEGLQAAMGSPAWAAVPALASLDGRRAAHDEIDEHLRAWTSGLTKDDVTAALQAQGVPSGPMLTATNQLDDAHFNARGYARPVQQQDLGPITFDGPAFGATLMAEPFIAQAPRLGEHTRVICSELLGLSSDEIDALFAAGVLEGPREG